MKEQRLVKQKQKKVKVHPQKWIDLTGELIKKRKWQFNFFMRLWNQWVKKSKVEPDQEVCKDLIQRVAKQKTLPEEAQQMVSMASQVLHTEQNKIVKTIAFLLGGGTMLLGSLFFLFFRAPKELPFNELIVDTNVLLWLGMIAISLVIFGIGWRLRINLSHSMMLYSILCQSFAAYASAKARGQGGSLFEAYAALDFLRKKNKEAFSKKFGFKKP